VLKGPTARDEATDAELRAGVGPLWQKVAIWRPAAVVFVYKRACHRLRRTAARRDVGPPRGRRAGGRPCFLMPGPYAPTEEVDEGLNFLRNLSAALPRDRA
jgi:hypothetical protein